MRFPVKNVYPMPEVVTGYELDPGKGWFSIVVPEAAVNIDANPSFELGLTGASVLNAAYVRSSAASRRGNYSIRVTPSSSADASFYKIFNTTTGQNYCWSIDLYDPSARLFWLYFSDSSNNRIGRIRVIKATGQWQRVWVNFSEYSGGSRRVFLVRKSTANTSMTDTTPFYVDGSLFENKAYPTTYFDGDSRGFDTNDTVYYWSGARHASQSGRVANTGSGGKEVNLFDLGFRLMAIVGLGLGTFSNVSTPISTGGALYQESIPQTRQFSLVGALGDNLQDMERARTALANYLTPNRTVTHQPMKLRYHRVDECTGEETETIDIACVYESGLEGNTESRNQQRLSLVFHQYIPYFKVDGEQAAVLGYQSSVTNFANIGYRDTDGKWKAMGTGVNDAVYAIAIGPDGSVYVGGVFTSAGGVANTRGIAKWDGTAWSALGTGVGAGGAIRSIAIGPDGTVYVGGSFVSIGGVAAFYIAKWNGAAWSNIGNADSDVNAMTVGPDGYLYAAGDFNTIGGTAANYIARWNGTAWSALGTGMNGTLMAIAFAQDRTLYAGGAFTTAGGVSANSIAKWDGSAWSALGTGTNGAVHAIAVGLDGTVYAGGGFTTAGGVLVSYVAKWNGTAWSTLGGVSSGVETLVVAPDGSMYAGGDFTMAGKAAMPDRGAVWVNGTWIPVDVNVQATSAFFYTYAFDGTGRLYLGGWWPSSTTALSASVTSSNNGNDRTYPVIEFTGPGKLWQVKNYTTGAAIYFNGLTLLAGESAILDTDPLNFSFVSSFRGDLQSYILDGSNTTSMYLQSGANNISAFMTGTTAASAITTRWTPAITTLDAATR